MNDLISRSALIMHLNDYALQVAPFRDMKSTWQYDAVQECIKAVEEQLTVEPAADVPDIYVGNKWIPVSERLPEGCEEAEIELLISTYEEYPDALIEETGFALYYPGTKQFHSVYGDRLDITEIVTAWKYLPSHYERKKVE